MDFRNSVKQGLTQGLTQGLWNQFDGDLLLEQNDPPSRIPRLIERTQVDLIHLVIPIHGKWLALLLSLDLKPI